MDLHWLGIGERVEYKILILTYKAIRGTAPAYLQDLVQRYRPARALRSQDEILLVAQQYRLKAYGARAFSRAAPSLWNKLSRTLRLSPPLSNFPKTVKTYLMSLY